MNHFILKQYIQLRHFMQREDGASAIEYAIIAGLIAVVIIAAVGTLGGNLNDIFGSITDKLGEAQKPPSGI